MAGVEKSQYQWVDRDCCAAYRVPDPEKSEHLNWDAWQTVDTVILEATSGVLQNTCASRSQFDENIGAKVDVWIPIRETSQQEGYHFHQAQWVTGTCVSSELFQAQGMTGVARWNFQLFDPLLIGDLNTASARVLGMAKYPILQVCTKDTGERFGLEYVEPGCRPVVLDWEKHKSKTTQAFSPADQGSTPTAQSADHPGELDVTSSPQLVSEFAPLHSSLDSAHLELQSEPESTRTLPVPSLSSSHVAHAEPGSNPETTYTPPMPMLASPSSTCTGPMKNGGRVFVLDHKLWTAPMKEAIDSLLNKHHGKKDMLKLVDQEYAAMVHSSCTDPNSMLHPTTRLHISQYVKHLAKLLNTRAGSSVQDGRSGEVTVPVGRQVCTKDTGERFGLEYVEPGCHPVVLDWEKHKSKTTQAFSPADQGSTPTAQSADHPGELDVTSSPQLVSEFAPLHSSLDSAHLELQSEPESTRTLPVPSLSSSHFAHAEPGSNPETTYTPPLPMLASPSSTCTGPMKTGGRVFVLDHKFWTAPMKEAIDSLLNKHHGKKDMLKLVDQEYAAMVHSSCTDPNSMLHPTTRLHISQYVKHLAKLQLWHSLTEGSETASVPVVTLHPAVVHPPAPAQTTPLTPESLEKIVEGIMERQQQQQQQPEQRKQTKMCLACGQPKSRYENDGSSVHFFYQQGPHGSLQELSPSSIGNACMKKAVSPQAASKARCALAGNRIRASRVAGENSTTEPPMPTLRGCGHLRQRWPALLMVLLQLRLFCT
ncbi:hypothetical protein Q7C36_005221 [Tachysurus vachellii]|uniref:Uncharacterized protein n=1 Tax=Tachysurus vachellii TaxID=175792 RepID=A0AA88NQ30_TACVA|nr:hypothetical protein Q7C36_005221 [Tachysurus vachellii]